MNQQKTAVVAASVAITLTALITAFLLRGKKCFLKK
jgi:hypothetical protein